MAGIVPIVGDFLQIRVNCQAASQLSQNVLHYRVASTGGGGHTLQQLADGFRAQIDNQYRAWMPATATFNGCTVQNLSPPRTNPFQSVAAAAAGTSAGDLAPRQASGLISTRTALGGRANHGRIYVGFLSSTFVDADGELDAGGLAVLVGVAGALGPTVTITTGPLSDQLQLVVRHPDAGAPPTPQGTDIVAIQAQLLIATQRRRGDYGRQNF
jgi:hypothetical protein